MTKVERQGVWAARITEFKESGLSVSATKQECYPLYI